MEIASSFLTPQCPSWVKAGRGAMSAPMSGLPESGLRADIGRLSERAIPAIAAIRLMVRFLRALFRLDVGRPDHAGPLLGFVADELAKIDGRARQRRSPAPK
jgi:hypothetical protein